MSVDSKMCPQCGGELRFRPQDNNMFRCIVCKYEEKAKKSDFSISECCKNYEVDELCEDYEILVDANHYIGELCPECEEGTLRAYYGRQGRVYFVCTNSRCSFKEFLRKERRAYNREDNFGINLNSSRIVGKNQRINKMKKFEFMKWMREYEKKSDATIHNYIVAFEYAQNHYCKCTESSISFYDIDDIEKFTSIFSKYIDGNLSQIGKIYSGAVRASLKAYLRFLEYKKGGVNSTSTKSGIPKVILHKKDGTIIENKVENRQPVNTVTHNYLDDIARIQNESLETITKKGFDFLNKLANLAISNGNTLEDALEKCLTVYTILTGNMPAPVTDKNKAHFKKALGKIRKWAFSPNQENHKLIKAYFKAYHRFDEPPMKSEIQRLCSDYNNSPYYVRNFGATYASLKIDSVKSNGKVFEDDGVHVWIWEEVEEELLKYEKNFYDPEKDK